MPQAVALELGFNVEVKTGVKPSQDIRIDDVRDLQNYFNTASSRGASRYVVVYPFDNMNANTANALLKTLEEPANGLRFVLVGSRVDKLLPTIRSRCQELTMPMPAISECLAWLETQGVQQPDVALGVAMNDPFEALSLAQTAADQLDLRKKFLEWLANPDQHANPPAGLEKVGLPTVLELAMRLCSDCVAQAHGLKATNFPWLSPKLMWVKSIGIERFSQLYQNLQKEFHLANHPINPRLALEYVGQQWQNLTK
jgi:DNA polymerase-3 subunit delta'